MSGAEGPLLPPRFTTGSARWDARVRQHRPVDAKPALARLGVAGLLLAVVAAGGAVVGLRSTVDEAHRPFVNTGVVGEPVSARVLHLTVRGVRTAAEVTDRPGWRHDTGGVWIVVRVRAEALGEEASIGYAAVRDSAGRTWELSGRINQPLASAGYRLQPGIPVEGEIAFEVPRDAATQLAVRIAGRGLDLRMEAIAEVPLPIDQAAIDSGLALAEPVLLAAPEVVPVAPETSDARWRPSDAVPEAGP